MRKLILFFLLIPYILSGQGVKYQHWRTPVCQLVASQKSYTLELTQNTWAEITNATKDFFADIDTLEATARGDSIIVRYTGSYLMLATLGGVGDEGVEFEVAFSIDEVIKNGAGDPSSSFTVVDAQQGDSYFSAIQLVGVLFLNEDEVLKINIRNNTDNSDFLINYCHIFMMMVTGINIE